MISNKDIMNIVYPGGVMSEQDRVLRQYAKEADALYRLEELRAERERAAARRDNRQTSLLTTHEKP